MPSNDSMKIVYALILLFFLPTSQASDEVIESDAVKRVKAKFLVNYKQLCMKGDDELNEAAIEKKCACQVKQFDENLTGDEVILLFSSKDKYQYPKLKSMANDLIKKCD